MTIQKRVDTLLGSPAGKAALLRALSRAELSTALVTKRGKARGRGQSSKAKGRTAVQAVKALLVEGLGVDPDSLLVKATSMPGTDLYVAPGVRSRCPWGIEVKCVESLNIWGALAQAEENCDDGLVPVVFFKRAKTPMFVALRAERLIALQERLNAFTHV
jgi:hypothetical protein